MATRSSRLTSNSAQAANATKEKEDHENEKAGDSDSEEEGGVIVGGWSPAGKSRKSKYVCKGGQKVCGLTISSKEDSIMCDACKDWFHPKCQGLSVDAFRALSKYDFLWLCAECRPKFMAILEIGKSLESRIEKAESRILDSLNESKSKDDQGFQEQLKNKIQQVEVSVNQIKEQQTKLENTMREQKDAVKAVPKYTEELKNSAHEIKKFVESQGQGGRENNIILHNIPECNSEDPQERKKNDAKTFEGVVSALLGGDVKVETTQVFRLGKRQSTQEQSATGDNDQKQKPRLMMIKLKDKDHVGQLIKRRTQLKEAGYPNVYLTKDLSPEERAAQKSIREELRIKGKDTHRIFRGKVVPRVR